MDDILQLEVHDIEVPVLTGIYSEETHLPQPLRISLTVDLVCPDRFTPDSPLSASKNYLDLKRAATSALPPGVHFTLIEAVADHIAETLFLQDRRVTRVEGQDRQAGDRRGRRIDRDHLGQKPPLASRLNKRRGDRRVRATEARTDSPAARCRHPLASRCQGSTRAVATAGSRRVDTTAACPARAVARRHR